MGRRGNDLMAKTQKIPATVETRLDDGRSKKRHIGNDRVLMGEFANAVMRFVAMRENVAPSLEPDELVQRAITITELMFEALIAKGHIVIRPAYDELPDEMAAGFSAGERDRK
jgi:hypothetical protein